MGGSRLFFRNCVSKISGIAIVESFDQELFIRVKMSTYEGGEGRGTHRPAKRVSAVQVLPEG